MDINDIRKLIANDEHQRLELKKSTGELKDAMHTACAFLNTDGGWLIFGIAPTTLKILGQGVTDNTQRGLAQALSGIEPAVNVHIEYIDVPEREGYKVIAIYFEAFVWGRTPYTYHGCPYYKVESTTKAMPREMFEERLRANKPQYYAWERQKADRIEIENPGVLPPQLTPETIKQPHISYPYNPIMADVLFKTTFLENWGSGVGRIIDACRAQNVPEPEWRMQGGFIVVKFRYPEKNGASRVQVEPHKGASSGQIDTELCTKTNQAQDKNEPSSEQKRTKFPSKTNQVQNKYEPSSKQIKALILSMTGDFIPIISIMKERKLKSRMRFRYDYIIPALNEGAIEREFPDNPNHPKQRYRLTAKALEWKQMQNNDK